MKLLLKNIKKLLKFKYYCKDDHFILVPLVLYSNILLDFERANLGFTNWFVSCLYG